MALLRSILDQSRPFIMTVSLLIAFLAAWKTVAELLPVAERRSSIVWTLPEDEAARVLALDEDAFNRALASMAGKSKPAQETSRPDRSDD